MFNPCLFLALDTFTEMHRQKIGNDEDEKNGKASACHSRAQGWSSANLALQPNSSIAQISFSHPDSSSFRPVLRRKHFLLGFGCLSIHQTFRIFLNLVEDFLEHPQMCKITKQLFRDHAGNLLKRSVVGATFQNIVLKSCCNPSRSQCGTTRIFFWNSKKCLQGERKNAGKLLNFGPF